MQVRLRLTLFVDGHTYAKESTVELVPGNDLSEVDTAMIRLSLTTKRTLINKLETMPPLED